MLDIYDIGTIISTILAIVFLLKEEKEKALVSIIILFAIMLLKYMLK